MKHHINHSSLHDLKSRKKRSGFTLIELLIAMAIFAVMAALAYGGLSSVINTSSAVQKQIIRLESLQRTVMFLERDMRQLIARPVNTDSAKRRSAVELGLNGDVLIEFTRGGNPNPGGLTRSSLQRVAYTLEEGVLFRQTWDQVDHLQTEEPIKLRLLEQLEEVEFRLLDANNKWQTRWAQNGAQGAALEQLPLAVEITLDHKEWGKIRRLIPVYGF